MSKVYKIYKVVKEKSENACSTLDFWPFSTSHRTKAQLVNSSQFSLSIFLASASYRLIYVMWCFSDQLYNIFSHQTPTWKNRRWFELQCGLMPQLLFDHCSQLYIIDISIDIFHCMISVVDSADNYSILTPNLLLYWLLIRN